MTIAPTALLSDRELLDATERAAESERRTTAELITLLAELDTRKLYLGEGYSSLFTYATMALHLSERACAVEECDVFRGCFGVAPGADICRHGRTYAGADDACRARPASVVAA